MTPTDKSVLDGVPVQDSTYKQAFSHDVMLSIVGACPQCGAPVYGPDRVWKGSAPVVQWSCECRERKDVSRKEIAE